MKTIQILGPGCPKCMRLAENATEAAREAREAGVECTVVKITDINRIVAYGVMMTPALAVDGEVKIVGKVASVEEIKAVIM
jgi:small redox-active disulfide protein 2